ncbi:MAG TPA: OmpA family protein [Cyclobacteriaceae bacterium]|nr:OmpA family protein [Cyclobacteriaceae bacterium]
MKPSKYFLILLISLISFSKSFSQDENNKDLSRQYLEVAEGIMAETKAMDDARDLMVVAADLDPENVKANFLAGYWHILTMNKELGAKYLLRVYAIQPEYRFDLEYWIARSYHYGLEFDKAIDFYTRYKEKLTTRTDYRGSDKVALAVVERNIYECENGKEYVANPVNYSIQNLGSAINSEFEDYAPVLNEAETEIVFTTRRRDGNLNRNVDIDNKPFEDIFMATKNNGNWGGSRNIGDPINTIYHDSNLALSADGKTLFIYKDVNNGDIYYSELTRGNVWSTPIPLPGAVNSSYSENSISLSPDGKTLYFTSDRPGGRGGLDIFMATKDANGNWTNIRNLGAKINTPFDEDGLFMDYDGKTLYFSSKGHKGMGGYDIYKTVFNKDTGEWSEPENLGYPVNTPDDDIYYVSTKDGKRAYYSSVRDDGFGYTDIYMITFPPEEQVAADKTLIPLQLLVSVVDENNNPLDVKIKLEQLPGNVLMPLQRTSSGKYQFSIRSESRADYRLSIEQEGYMFQNQTIALAGASDKEQSVDRNITMRKLSTGYSTVLRNIYFDFDKATLKEASLNELNKLERMMKQNTAMKVEISGHTDNIGNKTYNKNLSLRRANTVKTFLVSKGVDARRISTAGFGSEKPLASNDDEEEGRELNRRVEFKVLEN